MKSSSKQRVLLVGASVDTVLRSGDILLPFEEQATKLVGGNIITKFFWLNPKYMATQRIRGTVSNVPVGLTGHVLASFLRTYGRDVDVMLLRASSRTAYGDYAFWICLKREGFQGIPDAINIRDRQLMVMVGGRRPHYWHCKQVGHLAKFCPQKVKGNPKYPDIASQRSAKTAKKTTDALESINPSKTEESWTKVDLKGKKPDPSKKLEATSLGKISKFPLWHNNGHSYIYI